MLKRLKGGDEEVMNELKLLQMRATFIDTGY